MVAYSELLREWHGRPPGPTYSSISFAGDGLFLGAGTRLATIEKDRSFQFGIDGQEERILALLSVAYWHPISAHVLKSISGAVRAYGRGEKALAYIHLAHAGLPKIEGAEREFCRLFFADRLLSSGVSPLELFDGLGIDTAPIRLLKASPDEPKHPGWPAGTPGGLGGKFRPRNGDALGRDLPVAIPIADFSGGFHDAVVSVWMAYFQQMGIPAVQTPGIRLIGSNNSIIGYPDVITNIPGLGVTVVEVKTGNDPVFTPNQMAYFPMLQLGGHIYSTDPRTSQLGLTPGVPFPPSTRHHPACPRAQSTV